MSSKSVHKPIATQDQVAWAKKAKGYIEDAKRCHSAGAERPAVISLVGALESLLRLRFGMGPKDLNALIGEFDKDSYFEGHIGIHPRSTHQCTDEARRTLRFHFRLIAFAEYVLNFHGDWKMVLEEDVFAFDDGVSVPSGRRQREIFPID